MFSSQRYLKLWWWLWYLVFNVSQWKKILGSQRNFKRNNTTPETRGIYYVNELIWQNTQTYSTKSSVLNCVKSFILSCLTPGGEECFEVDRRSGEIRTTGQPLTPSKEYLLRVQAVDGQGRKGPPAAVSILAGYRPPQFTNSTYSLNVPENKAVGQPWVTAEKNIVIILLLLHDTIYKAGHSKRRAALKPTPSNVPVFRNITTFSSLFDWWLNTMID